MVATSPLDYSVQPYLGTDIAGAVMLACAALCLVIRVRDRERGMGWFALSLASLGIWLLNNDRHLPVGPELDGSPWWFLMSLSVVGMGPGLVAYLGLPPARARWMALGIALPALLFAAATAYVDLTGARVMRIWVHGLTALSFIAMGLTALWAARREPAAGHGLLVLVFWAVPLLALVLAVTRTDPVALRYWAILAPLLVGLALPSVSLYRRRRALEAEALRRAEAERSLASWNASLERVIEQKTRDLRNMVAGLESFNRSVSHDLRGPLGGISKLGAMADEALQRGDDSLARRALPAIVKQAEDSERLVSALLELARVGDAQIRPQPVDPERIAREVFDSIRAGEARPLPELLVRPMPAVHADPDLLRVIFLNLIGNAIKFTRDKADGRVEVLGEPDNGSVRFEVRDNGIGLPEGATEDLFSPFKRLHGSTFDGHGIGLSIVRRAVERHGGTIRASNRDGPGACFAFTLPGASAA